MDKITASGRVEAFLTGPDGRSRRVATGSNTLLFTCADAVARLFGGFVDHRPTTIGFVYGDSDSLGSAFMFTQGDRTPRSQDEVVGTGLGVYDQYIEQNKRFAAGSPEYTGNVVTFSASRPDSGTAVYIYGVLLKDAAGNVLAVKKFDECVKQNPGYAFAASWAVTFV